MAKKVYMPKHVLPQAKHFAEIHCEINGISKSDPNYKDEFEKAFYNFCEEAYTHSLTPSGEMGQNASAHISKRYYDKTTAFIDDVAKENKKRKFTKQETESMRRRFRMAVTTLTHLFLELKMGMQIKTKDGKISAFQYPEGGDPKDRVETEIAHYMRLMVATIIVAQNDVLFRQGEFNLDKLKAKQLFHGVDFQNDDLATIAKKLHNTNIRKKFVENVYNAYKTGSLDLDRTKTPKLKLVTSEQLKKTSQTLEKKPKKESPKPEKKAEVKKEKDAKRTVTKKKPTEPKKKVKKAKKAKVSKKPSKKTKKESRPSSPTLTRPEFLKKKLDNMIKEEMNKIKADVQFHFEKSYVKDLMKDLNVSDYKQIEVIIKDENHPKYKKLYNEAFRNIFFIRYDGSPSKPEVFDIYEELIELGQPIKKPNPKRRR